MAEPPTLVAAVDLGASSGRVVLGRGGADGFVLEEVHRFPNEPVRTDGVLRWDIRSLYAGMLDGLRAAAAAGGRLAAVAVDGWAVDYGLLDAEGGLIADPVHYRDIRTETAFAAADQASLYAATGIASHPFNTVFQLMSESGSAQLQQARHALLVPDLMTYWLCGVMGTELTNASTTQLLDTRTMEWASGLASDLAVPVGLFPPLRKAGDRLAAMSPAVVAELGLPTAPAIVLAPSHDTAAAVAGVPAEDNAFAFVCTGTWALAGVELPAPVITDAGRAAGFSNEVGLDGTIRFLRNVTGFWLLQESVREWQVDGHPVDLDELTRAAAQVPGGRALIDVQDPEFAAPGGMPQRIVRACRRTSGIDLTARAEILRCILDSMSVAIRHAVRDAVRVTDRPVRTVHVVGGGVANPLFCQLIADACRLPVVAGPTEAASWGSVLVQARALGVIEGTLPELRSLVRAGVSLRRYVPSDSDATWDRADDIVLSGRATLS
jgi:rhamnulokinase